MKIIYIGGYTNKRNSHFYNYCSNVKKFISVGKNVVFVTFGQKAGYFNQRFVELYGFIPEIIDENSSKNINWNAYDLIYIPGGSSENLKKGLVEYGFDINKLKKDVIIIGDSAGANILSKYYLSKTIDMSEHTGYSLMDGLNPSSNLLVVCHTDNIEKAPLEKLEIAKALSIKNGYRLLLLKENEAKLVENNGDIQDFCLSDVLSKREPGE